ncbi:MBL fold metallo-hydrolase [Kribbella sp. NBC_01245]|uniref:MBL fold metallo-hydrolase n=1 Tax=Kribbella sp. NBC_01245 TaxID=2903578 RepID=UPI002E28A1E6|nr:MBL fold metallo-hydrolase [Kribbella sp. NBC_01245]
MKLTKYTHACVRLEKDGKVLLVDPGIWTEPEAFEGVDGILVTHEHPDHLDVARILPLAVPIWTNASVASVLTSASADSASSAGVAGLADRVTVVSGGESFEAAGFSIGAFGNDHAISLPELGVPCQNVAYLIEDAVYHPGDSWTRPNRAVHTNLVPLAAPWHTLRDAIAYIREVKAEQAIGIHDAGLSQIGLTLSTTMLTNHGQTPYTPLTPGTTTHLP